MRVFRRRRILTVVAFVVFAGVIFLCFQLFSFEALNVHSRLDTLQSKLTYMKKKDIKLEQDIKSKKGLDDAELRKNKCLLGDCADEDVKKEAVVNKYHQSTIKTRGRATAAHKEVQRHLHPRDHTATSKSPPIPLDGSLKDVPRGILLKMASKYISNVKGLFICLDSQEQIPFTAVNDDYCDCKDGSDEPGTSACPDTKFYCAFQLSLDSPIWTTSSKVNDGICDCCDGSDEWANVTLPPHVKLKDGVAGYGLYQTPCSNRCHVLEARRQQLSDVRQRGLVLKQQYREAGRSHIKPNQLYGPDGVFYKLSQECYSTTSDVYKYIVCPFKEIHQEGGTHGVNIIGREPRWLPGPADKPRLEMSRGSPRGCPESESRKSIVEFECGLEDKVLSVQELEVCTYTIGFSSPAAC